VVVANKRAGTALPASESLSTVVKSLRRSSPCHLTGPDLTTRDAGGEGAAAWPLPALCQGTCASSAGPLNRMDVARGLWQRQTFRESVAWSAESLPWCISMICGAPPTIASCMALSGTDRHHESLPLRYEGNRHTCFLTWTGSWSVHMSCLRQDAICLDQLSVRTSIAFGCCILL